MARKNFILTSLLEQGEVIWRPVGQSMAGKINSGEQVRIKRVPTVALRVGDIVYAKVKGNYYLHLLSSIDNDRYQISNNHGYINGWVSAEKIFGVCVEIKENIILSDEEIKKRIDNSMS